MVKAPARDQRLDAIRGWMQLSIFYSHAHGSFTGAWLIHAGWGISDSSEQFVFLSGFGLGSVFVLKQAGGGFGHACRDLGRRMMLLWRMHLLVFLCFGVMVAAASNWLGEPGWDLAMRAPLLAALGGVSTLYQPAFMGILPLFLYAMATLPLCAWAMHRHGVWALAIPAVLWVLAQAMEADVPALFGTDFAFNPLGWVPLFMLGAWFGRQALLRGHAIGRNPWLLAGAMALILVSAVMHKLGVLPDAWVGKEQLAPLRLLHALACAYLVAVLIPRDVAWARSRAGGMLAVLGRNSLQVFSLGLFFSYIAANSFRQWPQAQFWTEPVLLITCSLILWRFAIFVESRRSRPSTPAQPSHMRLV
jgi:hypothetical protein